MTAQENELKKFNNFLYAVCCWLESLEKLVTRFLELITVALFFAFTFGGLDADFFVILLEGGQIFTGLGEFTFFHTFTDVPMDEGTLGVHKIELVIDAGEHLGDGGGVGDHAAGAHNLGEIATRDDGGWLVIDTALETGRGPVNELDGSLGLDGGHGGVDVLRDNITTVHHAAGHVLTVTRIALNHHASGLEDGVGDLGNGELLMVSLLGGDDGSVRRKHEMDTGVRHQVGLEFGDIDVEGTIETEGSGQRRDDLSQQTVQVGVGGALDVEGTTADVVQGFIVNLIGDIGVLEERVDTQHGVVRFNNGGGDLRAAPDGEGDLGLLAVIDREAFQEQAAQTGTGTTTDGVVHEETLETSAVVSQLADAIEDKVNNLFTDGVVTTGEIVTGIFLTGDQLLGMEQLTVGTSADFVNNGGLQIDEDGTRNVLAGTGLGEEGVERIITATDGLVGGHLAIRLDTMLEAEKLPASVTDLDTGLSDVDANHFTHG